MFFFILGFLAISDVAQAQKQELAFSIGGIASQTRGFNDPVAGQVNISADKTFGVNYGHRLVDGKVASLFGEVEFVAIPNRSVTSASATVAQSYASLYAVPGVRLKLFPSARFSPWGAAGAGYALYEESSNLSDGQRTLHHFLHRGVVDYGGGVDVRLFHLRRWGIGLRGEVRDFYSGNPNVNVKLNSSGQHNVVASGGLVFGF